MVTQISEKTRLTAEQQIAQLKKELDQAKGQTRVVQARMYPPNDRHPGIWLIRLLQVNPSTEFPVKVGVHTGEDGKQYNDYATFKWLEVDDKELLEAANKERRSVNLYFNKKGKRPN